MPSTRPASASTPSPRDAAPAAVRPGWLARRAGRARRDRRTPRPPARSRTRTSPRWCRRARTVLVRVAEPGAARRRSAAMAGRARARSRSPTTAAAAGRDPGDATTARTSTPSPAPCGLSPPRSPRATRRRRTRAPSAASRPASPTSSGWTRPCTCPGGRRRARGCRPASVAIAAEYTAVYPSPSPGGWHLIGTTDAGRCGTRLREPPSLVEPGTSVRFVPVGR